MTSPRRPQLFGTDGIRAEFGTYPLDEPTVRRFGQELATLLTQARSNGEPVHVVLGGDPRASTPILGQWLAAGLAAGGAHLTYLGMVTTPCVAFTTRRLGATAGIAISASHNPYPDNGIKLIDGAGFKWSPEAEAKLEARLFAAGQAPDGDGASILPAPDLAAVERYLEYLAGSLGDDRPLTGLAIALDNANGAASPYAPRLFERLGARVVALYTTPDGTNVNRGCGSTHPEALAAATRAESCDLGFAFDGDADRVIVADERGEVRDGDAILYLWARDLAQQGRLPQRRIVATSMSNLGLEAALGRDGIAVVRCDVGDREVVATLQRESLVLGGEQSGHVVNLDLSTTGDGLLTALAVADLRQRAEQPLSEVLRGFERFPQLLRNVRVQRKPDLDSLPRIQTLRDAVTARLADEGRLVLRYSGTEPLARIMIEGRDPAMIEGMAGELAAAIAEELG